MNLFDTSSDRVDCVVEQVLPDQHPFDSGQEFIDHAVVEVPGPLATSDDHCGDSFKTAEAAEPVKLDYVDELLDSRSDCGDMESGASDQGGEEQTEPDEKYHEAEVVGNDVDVRYETVDHVELEPDDEPAEPEEPERNLEDDRQEESNGENVQQEVRDPIAHEASDDSGNLCCKSARRFFGRLSLFIPSTTLRFIISF